MAVGDVVLTNYGTFSISGAALKTAADTINLGATKASGAEIFLVPAEFGQVQLLKTTITGW